MVVGSSTEVYALSLGAALFWGLGPVFSKRGLADTGTWMEGTLVVVGSRMAMYWILLFSTGGVTALAGISVEIILVFSAAGIVASGIGRLVFYIGIDEIGSTITNAFTNTRPLFAVGLAVIWLGEAVTVQMAVGTLVIVTGLVVLTVSKGGDITGWDRRYLVFPLAAAVFYALGNVVRRFGFTATTVDPLQAVAVGDLAAFLFIATTAVVSRKHQLEGSRESYSYFVAGGLCAGVGLLLLFQALSLDGGDVAIVDPLVATAPLFTTIFAAVVLRDIERVTLGTVLGILVAIAGVGLVTTG